MRYFSLDNQKDGIILVARIALMVLFIIFGWQKLVAFSYTAGYMASLGVPVPAVATAVAVAMEFGVGLLIALGFYTRPLTVIMAVYVLATSFIGHPYWHMTGMDQYANMINFYKNISIIGGLLLLAITGPGRYSLDRR
ncbi:DoxX family protein [Pantoea sp. A4]|uniref:DoxX family protein n=1 Tax=Pantoea sp. A4 TaxID=1225184 RepID=UPI00037E3E5A|nr:DoxX family protein [Pantoea sp. A4]